MLALAITGNAAAGPQFGFAEDATKYSDDGGAALFTEMNTLQTTTNRVAVFWNADDPTTIQDQDFLDRMLPVAQAHDIQVVFAVYPQKPTQAPTNPAAADAFCNYVLEVMQRYPYVRKVIIGNEPNQPRFWQPIWNGSTPASPAAMEVVLASCYDKLKAFDPTLDVIGVGLSPRGNDDPYAVSNSSLSPVRWIKALGDAYRASGREKPLFDEWSWHCYPNVNTDEVETGYAWPNTGCVNAARVKLALWDAFHGTAQPTLPGYPIDTTGATLYGDTARMFIDETGWQVDTTGLTTTGLNSYVDTENVPTINEATQAEDYEKLVHLANCEPTLTDVRHLPRDRRVRPRGLPERRAPRRLERAAIRAFAAVLRAARDPRRQRVVLGRRLADARRLPLLDDRRRSGLQDVPVPRAAAVRGDDRGRRRQVRRALRRRRLHVRDHVQARQPAGARAAALRRGRRRR